MEYSRRPTKSIPKENQLKILNKIYQIYLVSTTAIIGTNDGLAYWRLSTPSRDYNIMILKLWKSASLFYDIIVPTPAS